MNLQEAEVLAKPYIFRGKRHSVRTLHTALEKACGVKGAFGADKDVLYIRPYDKSLGTIRFPRTFEGELSIVGEQEVVHLMAKRGNGPACQTREMLDDSNITTHRPDVNCANCLNGVKRTD